MQRAGTLTAQDPSRSEAIVHQDEFITPLQLTARYKNVITLRTLANWRSIGEGPKYTKIGGRVLYAMSAVLAWEMKRQIGPSMMFAAMMVTAVLGYDINAHLNWYGPEFGI